jgi:hypothetical protein
MKRMKLMLGAMVLSVGAAGAAWAQPAAPDHDVRNHAVYSQTWRGSDHQVGSQRGGSEAWNWNMRDRDDRNNGRIDRDDVQRGGYVYNARGNGDGNDAWHNGSQNQRPGYIHRTHDDRGERHER